MPLSFLWKVEELIDRTDLKGRRMVRVHECYEGDVPEGVENRYFDMPGVVHAAFIRARREVVKRQMEELGATQKVEIDWSFLEKGTKQ